MPGTFIMDQFSGGTFSLIRVFLVLLYSGCWSYVGYIASSPQVIGMAEWGCMTVSTGNSKDFFLKENFTVLHT
jgi:hypothetical protein